MDQAAAPAISPICMPGPKSMFQGPAGSGSMPLPACLPRNVSFRGKHAGSGIEPDPAGPWNIDFGPGMQIGEIAGAAAWSIERLLVRFQLDQVAGNETRGQPH